MEKRYNIIYADPPWKYDRQKGEGVAADIYQRGCGSTTAGGR